MKKASLVVALVFAPTACTTHESGDANKAEPATEPEPEPVVEPRRVDKRKELMAAFERFDGRAQELR